MANLRVHNGHSGHSGQSPTLVAERAVLGAMLRDPSVIDVLSLLVVPDHFYSDAHQRVCRVIQSLHGNAPVTPVSVAEELKKQNWLDDAGSYPYLAELFDHTPTAAEAEYYAGLVKEAWLYRRVWTLGGEMQRDAAQPTGSAEELMGRLETELLSLSDLGESGDVVELAREIDRAFDRIDARRSGEPCGLGTGLRDVDQLLTGLRDSELTVVAARPSVGKSAFAFGTCLYLTLQERVPVFLASLEMSREELSERLLAMKAGVETQSIRRGILSHEDVDRMAEAGRILREAALCVRDKSKQSMTEIAANARRLKRSRGIKAVVVDYLQLVEPSNLDAPRHEQVGEISRRLKMLARELSLPVVALAQLNRAADDREPKLSDLRESGSIEADADNVLLLHRPTEPNGAIALIDCIVAKQRNGPTGKVTLAYNRPFVRFENYGGEAY